MEDQTSDHVRYRVVVRGRFGEHLADAFGQLDLDSQAGQTSLPGTSPTRPSSTGSSTNCATSGSTSSASTL